MDKELKAYLDGKFAELNAKFSEFDGKFAELDRKVAELDRRFAELDRRFAELDGKFTELRAEIEATETRLLSEFWKWGRSSEQRMRRIETSDATSTERLAALEERIFTLERKVAGVKE